MAKQTFTTGSVLTAAQMNNLQANDYNWTVDSKSASYVLVAADAGKRIEMNAAGATTITVNTGLFAAGDMVYISNIGAGICTVTAGTATVNKSTNASLALSQYQSGMLYFVSASSAIFYPFDIGAATSGKSYTLLNSGGTALTGAATVTVSGITGDDLLILISGASGGASSSISFRINGITTNNYSILGGGVTTSVFANNIGPDGNNYAWFAQQSNNTASAVSGYARIFGCKSSTLKPYIIAAGASAGGGTNQSMYVSGGTFTTSSAVTSISIFSDVGNLDAGTVYVYEAQ